MMNGWTLFGLNALFFVILSYMATDELKRKGYTGLASVIDGLAIIMGIIYVHHLVFGC